MDPRSEDAGLAGILTFTMGGRVLVVPTLKIRQSREWKSRIGAIAQAVDIPDGADMATTIGALANAPIDAVLALVLAYDTACETRPGILGGRDAVEDMATDAEAYEAFRLMVIATYPKALDLLRSAVEEYGPQLRVAAMLAMQRISETSSRERPTNGPSPDGDSTPTPLKPVSPTSSSSSSGRMRSDGSGASRRKASS